MKLSFGTSFSCDEKHCLKAYIQLNWCNIKRGFILAKISSWLLLPYAKWNWLLSFVQIYTYLNMAFILLENNSGQQQKTQRIICKRSIKFMLRVVQRIGWKEWIQTKTGDRRESTQKQRGKKRCKSKYGMKMNKHLGEEWMLILSNENKEKTKASTFPVHQVTS